MTLDISLIVNALILSSLYAIIAIGFTLIFGVGGVLNLAHGALLTLGAFTCYFLSDELGYNVWIGVIAGIILPAIVGGSIYLAVIRYIRGNALIEMIITLLVGVALVNLLRVFITHSTITVDDLLPGQVDLVGYPIQKSMLLIFVASWIVITAILAFVKHSQSGQAIRAINMSSKGATLVGINIDRINLYTWILASGLAGFAGVLLLSFQTGGWRMGTDPLIISFAIVILGGLGSIRGSLIGAYVIGIVETLTTTLINPQLTGFSSLLIVVIVLMFRPSGLFGRDTVNEMRGQEGLF